MLRNIRYIISMRGKCSATGSWLDGSNPCNKLATRFERWEGGDFSISCKRHHSKPLLWRSPCERCGRCLA